jgi:peptidoglycan hydrolase-like protein with peptidoglycan-binding domain
MVNSRFGVVAVACAAVATAAAATCLAVLCLHGRPLPTGVQPTSALVSVALEAGASEQSRPATLRVYVGERLVATSPGDEGVVTAVFVEAGDHVEVGTPVYCADGIVRRAYVGPEVFFRTLSTGAKGDDVAALQKLLNRLTEHELPSTGIFGSLTSAAVRAYQLEIGVEPDGVFQPSWLVRMEAAMDVESVRIRAGSPAPQLGDVVMDSVRPVTGVNVDFDSPEGAFVFKTSGHEVALDAVPNASAGGPEWRASEPTQVTALLDAQSAGGLGEAVGAADEGTPGPAAFSFEGRIALAQPTVSIVAPAAALVASGANPERACVWTEDGGPGNYIRHSGLRVLETAASGAVHLDGELSPGAKVLLRPLLAVEDPTCQ